MNIKITRKKERGPMAEQSTILNQMGKGTIKTDWHNIKQVEIHEVNTEQCDN